MKKIYLKYVVTALVMLFAVSCSEDAIDLQPVTDSEANYFQDEDQMTKAIIGAYAKIAFFYQLWGTGENISAMWLLPDDDLTTPDNNPYEIFVNLTSENTRAENAYKFLYQLIGRTIIILDKIEENGSFAFEKQPELKNYIRGEALFLRAFGYFRLYTFFGSAAPLVTARLDTYEDAFPPSSNGTQLLDQAITDLQEAADLLPPDWDADYKGRATQNSANGLLGKILVYRGSMLNQVSDFTAAITAFNNISGVQLAPNYNDNFDYTKENNVEGLFEFQATQNSEANLPFGSYGFHTDTYSTVGDMSFWTGWADNATFGTDYYRATASLMSAFEAGDPRIQYTFDPAASTNNVLKYVRNGQRVDNYSYANYFGCNVNNVRILRYADVMLLKAEAIVRSGGDFSEAIGLINQIRYRARMSNPDGIEVMIPADRDVNETNITTVLDWIFQERRVELAFEEGNRWEDLKRRFILGEIDLETLDFDSMREDFDFELTNKVFPLPISQIVDNTNLVQNTGY
ncbi:MAG: RagB/SusD family nutrient uptake outer membrane protein [Bacteroidales bacterium]|nr:RagB/SusD family nutrient uptake outer membrane protein [Bacteroidales bacterium]